MYTMCLFGTQACQKVALDPQEPELQVVVNCHVGDRIELSVRAGEPP